ncbi:MAG: response regulator transcription factor [Chlorobi bacterium]|nr:response regulator transcription factor [Chlorobiota bacterium]
MGKIKVIIVEDQEIVRDGLSLILSAQDGIDLIGEAASPKELFELLVTDIPDIILMDIGLPQMSGIELTRKIISEYTKIKVVFLTANPNNITVEHCLMAGGKGFLTKDCSKGELVKAIETVNNNKYYIAENISQEVFSRYINQLNMNKNNRLSEREIEIVRAFANGLSYNQISQKLNISKKTIETHRNNIFIKTGLKNNADIIKYAIKNHIIEI